MKKFLILSALAAIISISYAQNTTRKQIQAKAEVVSVPEIDTLINEESNIGSIPLFNPNGLSIKGFDKRASDSKESFFVTNNTHYHISRIELLLRYTDLNGNLIHQRTSLLECDIPAGEVRQLYIASFDKKRSFYYYLSNVPRSAASPFKVAFKLLRYDIIIK